MLTRSEPLTYNLQPKVVPGYIKVIRQDQSLSRGTETGFYFETCWTDSLFVCP